MADTKETIVISLRLDNASLNAQMAETEIAIKKNKSVLQTLNKSFKDAMGAGNQAEMRKLQIEITKLEIENKKLAKTQKTLTAEQLGGVQALRAQKKAFLDAAVEVGEADERYQGFLEQAAAVEDQLQDLNDRLKALDPGERAQAFMKFGQQVVGVFAAGQAAAALFGNENKELQELFVRLHAAQTVLAGVQAVADAQKEASLLKVVLMERLRNAEVQRGIVVTQGATVAQRLWGLVTASSLGPLGALLLIVGAVSAAIAIYVSNTERARTAERQRATAMDGTIIKTKELRDAYNEHVVAVRALENEYKVMRGEMSRFDAAMDNSSMNLKKNTQEVANETAAQLTELGGFWNDLGDVIMSGGSPVAAAMKRSKEIAKITREGNDKIRAEELKAQDEQAKIQKDADEERLNTIRTAGKTETATQVEELMRRRDELLLNDKFTASERITIAKDFEKQMNRVRFEALSPLRALNAEFKQLLVESIRDARQKELEAEREALKAKLAELVGFGEQDAAQRAKLTEISREKQRQINVKYDKLDIERALKAEIERQQLEIQSMQAGAQNRIAVRTAMLENQRRLELQNTELTERERLNIEEKYRQLRNQAETEEHEADMKRFYTNEQAKLQAKIMALDNEAIAIGKKHDTALAERLKLLELERNQQLQQDNLTAGERLLIEQKFITDTNALYQQNLEQLLQINAAKADMIHSLVDGIGSVMQIAAIDSQEAAEFQRAIALVQIGIETAKSIANIISIATAPTPDNILSGGLAIPAKIIAGVGTVLANIARAKSLIMDDVPQAPTFEKGGAIKFGQFGGKSHAQGGTRGVFSDGTNVEVENGETFFVLNRKATPRLVSALSGLNIATGGRSLGAAGGTYAAQGTAIDFVSGPAERRAINQAEMNLQMLRLAQSVPVVAYIDDIQAKASAEQTRLMRAVI